MPIMEKGIGDPLITLGIYSFLFATSFLHGEIFLRTFYNCSIIDIIKEEEKEMKEIEHIPYKELIDVIRKVSSHGEFFLIMKYIDKIKDKNNKNIIKYFY